MKTQNKKIFYIIMEWNKYKGEKQMDKLVLYEYEQILLGNKKKFSKKRFLGTPKAVKQKAIDLLRYICSDIMKLSPSELKDNLTVYTCDRYKLWTIIEFVNFPPEFEKKEDIIYLLSLMYPKIYHVDEAEAIRNTYKKFYDGKLYKFPKGFFNGNDGEAKAEICLNYALTLDNNPLSSIYELYHLFSDNSEYSILKKYKLYTVCQDFFDSALEYLHYSLPRSQRSTLLFNYFEFQKEFKKVKEEIKEKKLEENQENK